MNLERFHKLAFFGADTESGQYFPEESLGSYSRAGSYSAFSYNPTIAATTLINDEGLTPAQKAVTLDMLAKATSKSPGFGFTTNDLVRAGIGAGLGYGAATVTGKILGAVFGLSPSSQRKLSNIGAVGGLLRATNIWR